jgi:hypothetical protein
MRPTIGNRNLASAGDAAEPPACLCPSAETATATPKPFLLAALPAINVWRLMPKWRQCGPRLGCGDRNPSRLNSTPVPANRPDPAGFPSRTCISTLYRVSLVILNEKQPLEPPAATFVLPFRPAHPELPESEPTNSSPKISPISPKTRLRPPSRAWFHWLDQVRLAL